MVSQNTMFPVQNNSAQGEEIGKALLPSLSPLRVSRPLAATGYPLMTTSLQRIEALALGIAAGIALLAALLVHQRITPALRAQIARHQVRRRRTARQQPATTRPIGAAS